MVDMKDVKAVLAHVAKVDGDVLCRAALREIEALEAERDALKRELDNMRDLIRGAAKNMLKAVEGDQ